jgi:hypothetical protein
MEAELIRVISGATSHLYVRLVTTIFTRLIDNRVRIHTLKGALLLSEEEYRLTTTTMTTMTTTRIRIPIVIDRSFS